MSSEPIVTSTGDGGYLTPGVRRSKMKFPKEQQMARDEDQEYRPRKRREPSPPWGASRVLFPPILLDIGKVVLLGVAGLTALAAMVQENSIQTAALAGLACVAGIAARILQAEEHHIQNEQNRRYEEEMREYRR